MKRKIEILYISLKSSNYGRDGTIKAGRWIFL